MNSDQRQSPPSPAACLRLARARFEARMADGLDVSARRYRVGRHVLNLRAAAATAVIVGPALEHLLVEDGQEEEAGGTVAMVDAWDEASTGLGLPDLPDGVRRIAPNMRIRAAHIEQTHGRYVFHPKGMTLFAPDERRGLFWWTGEGEPSLDALAAPLLCILYWWLQEEGLQLVHGAAVAWEDRGAVLFVGPSGSGKSTAALACLDGGIGYLGDDYVLVDPGPPPRVLCLYGTGKVRRDHLAFFPRLRTLPLLAAPAAEDKVVLRALPHEIVRSAPLRAIVRPRPSGRRGSRYRRLTGPEILRALAPSTVLQLPGAAAKDLTRLASLARGVPGYGLEAGSDPAGIVSAVDELLAGVPSAG